MSTRKEYVRLVDNPSDKLPSLLSLPKSDFTSSFSESNNHDNNKTEDTNADGDKLLLLKVPPSISLNDLTNGSAHMLVREDGDGERFEMNDNDNDDYDDPKKVKLSPSASTAPSFDCKLILEERGISFGLVRVETSNSYILVPPILSSSSTTNNNDDDGDDDSDSRLCKRQKIVAAGSNAGTAIANDKNMVHMPARLLRENSTFFLECEPTDLIDLPERVKCLLSRHTYDNRIYDNEIDGEKAVPRGYTIVEMATRLQCSRKEVISVLHSLEAFPLPRNVVHDGGGDGVTGVKEEKEIEEQYYGVLGEELRQDAMMEIVATLSEWEGAKEYGCVGKGVSWNAMVGEVTKRGSDGVEECVIRHCLDCWRRREEEEDGEMNVDKEIGVLDVNKIALFLAHHLFNSQTVPWEQSAFLSEWHRLIPGVGKIYEPRADLLKGLALEITNIDPVTAASSNTLASEKGLSMNVAPGDDGADLTSSSTREQTYLEYFPENKQSLDPKKRFQALFQKRQRWKLETLKPYIDRLGVGSKGDIDISELLLKYTRIVKDENGDSWYMKK